jgi:hypothetical protein
MSASDWTSGDWAEVLRVCYEGESDIPRVTQTVVASMGDVDEDDETWVAIVRTDNKLLPWAYLRASCGYLDDNREPVWDCQSYGRAIEASSLKKLLRLILRVESSEPFGE